MLDDAGGQRCRRATSGMSVVTAVNRDLELERARLHVKGDGDVRRWSWPERWVLTMSSEYVATLGELAGAESCGLASICVIKTPSDSPRSSPATFSKMARSRPIVPCGGAVLRSAHRTAPDRSPYPHCNYAANRQARRHWLQPQWRYTPTSRRPPEGPGRAPSRQSESVPPLPSGRSLPKLPMPESALPAGKGSKKGSRSWFKGCCGDRCRKRKPGRENAGRWSAGAPLPRRSRRRPGWYCSPRTSPRRSTREISASSAISMLFAVSAALLPKSTVTTDAPTVKLNVPLVGMPLGSVKVSCCCSKAK